MKFAELTALYKESPDFLSKEKSTKYNYSKSIERLIAIGGGMPIKDSMLDAVARSRSRKLIGRANNLSQFWYMGIASFKEKDTVVTPTIQNSLVTVLNVVYGWAVIKGIVATNENPAKDVERFKDEKSTKRPYTVAEMDRIEAAIKEGKYNEMHLAYAHFLLFAFYSACRPDEMYNHESTWFTKRGGELFFEAHDAKGKAVGRIARYVKMLTKEQEVLDWFKKQPKALGHEQYTFRTDKGKKFSQPLVCVYTREVCRVADVEPRELYDARRGHATEMWRRGYPIEDIANRLGNTPRVAMGYIVADMVEKAGSYKGL